MIDFLCEMVADYFVQQTTRSVKNITPSYQARLSEQYNHDSRFQMNCRKLLGDVIEYNDRVDLPVIACIALNESRFDYNAVSPDGARGIMQVIGSNIRRFPRKKDWQIAIDYLEEIGTRSKSWCHVLTEYNTGRNFCAKDKKNRSRQYAEKILACKHFVEKKAACQYFDICETQL